MWCLGFYVVPVWWLDSNLYSSICSVFCFALSKLQWLLYLHCVSNNNSCICIVLAAIIVVFALDSSRR